MFYIRDVAIGRFYFNNYLFDQVFLIFLFSIHKQIYDIVPDVFPTAVKGKSYRGLFERKIRRRVHVRRRLDVTFEFIVRVRVHVAESAVGRGGVSVRMSGKRLIAYRALYTYLLTSRVITVKNAYA